MAEMIRIKDGLSQEEDPLKYCRELEKGNILFFPKAPFPFPQEEIDFLLEQRQGRSPGRKNIAYKPHLDRVTNHASKDPKHAERMREVLLDYSQRVAGFLSGLLAAYASKWKLDYTSFRPFRERERKLRLRARDDLLHCDAFPTRPTHGDRILRFFMNINAEESRRWVTSALFSDLIKEFGGTKDLPFPSSVSYSLFDRQMRRMKKSVSSFGVKVPLRSPYDTFMLRMHNFLKENEEFQKNSPKDYWEFPPGSCWAVFTDQVSHATLSGSYALEQTFLVPFKAMLFPDLSPVGILETVTNGNMIDFSYASRPFQKFLR